MSAPEFLDTNVVIYAYDPDDPRKQQIAQNLMKRGGLGDLVISTQVLSELAVTLLHKMRPRARVEDVTALLNILYPFRLIVPDAELVRRAVAVHAAYGVHFYDGMIVAAAERGGCRRIWSEDLSAGQEYFGITVENPFAIR
jgi:predicted nucleic acid-binding protein